MQICKNYSVKAGVYREPKGRIVVERDRTRRVVNVYELLTTITSPSHDPSRDPVIVVEIRYTVLGY